MGQGPDCVMTCLSFGVDRGKERLIVQDALVPLETSVCPLITKTPTFNLGLSFCEPYSTLSGKPEQCDELAESLIDCRAGRRFAWMD